MKKLMFILSLSIAGFIVNAQLAEQENMLQKANQYYSDGDYAQAASQYESILNSGYESSGLYFNLGNAYFKQNNITSAILFYEKARKLDPTDENIRFNLDLANSRTIDKMEPLPEFFLRSWWKSARDNFSSDQWAKTGVACFIAALIAIALFIIFDAVFRRKIAFWTGIIFFALMSVSFLFSYSGYMEYSRQSTGIIFNPTVTVKSSPNESSVDLFVIHEGTKVFVMDHVESWSEVRLANGNVGWVKSESFRPI